MFIHYSMKRPIFMRPLSDAERETLEAGLRSPDAFTLRRCQILLASDRGKNAYQIAHELGCNPQTARNAIHAFNQKGLPEALRPGSKHPHTVHRAFAPQQAEALREMLHRSPREFGRESSLWTYFRDGGTGRLRGGAHTKADLGGDHQGYALAPSRSQGDAGQTLDHISRPPLRKKKRRRDRLMEVAQADPETWAVGFLDECWWSRLALPTLSSWAEEGKPLRLVQKSVAKDDPDPKAISCYGLYLPEIDEQTWLRFVDGRPVSSITTQFLRWSLEELEEIGKKVLLLIWDNASWHVSKEVRRWLGKHNRHVKESGEGVRIVSCLLPKQSPWLNAIEPKWVHAKRKVVEPNRLLGAYELAERVCRVFGCPHYEHLSVPREVA